MNRIEVNVQTGETTEIPLSAEEVAAAEARTAAEAAARPVPVTDPVAKLAAFLAANPDVAALLDHG